MIENAKDKTLSDSSSGLPDVSDGVRSYFQPLRVGIVSKEMIDGYAQHIVQEFIDTLGVKTPMPQKLAIQKGGERSWKWFDVYLLPEIKLEVDDVFCISDEQFRVMSSDGWNEYGFTHYEVIQDYQKIYNLNPEIL